MLKNCASPHPVTPEKRVVRHTQPTMWQRGSFASRFVLVELSIRSSWLHLFVIPSIHSGPATFLPATFPQPTAKRTKEQRRLTAIHTLQAGTLSPRCTHTTPMEAHRPPWDMVPRHLCMECHLVHLCTHHLECTTRHLECITRHPWDMALHHLCITECHPMACHQA